MGSEQDDDSESVPPRDPAEIRGVINIQTENLEKGSELASQYIDATQQEIKSEVEAANKVLSEAQTTSASTVQTLTTESASILQSVDNIYDTLERYLALISVMFLVVFYVVYIAFRGLVFDPEILMAPIIAIIFYGSVLTVLKRLRRQIGATKTSVGTSLGTASASATRLNGKSISVESDMSSTKSRMTELVGSVQKVVGVFRDYIPALETHYSNLARVNKQETFVQTLANSLREYGFPIEGKAQAYLNSFVSLADTSDEWLEASTKRLASILGTDEMVLKLAYYDFVGDQENSKNCWLTIAKNPASIRNLVQTLIKNGVVQSEYLGKDLARFGPIENLIASESTFDLSHFREVFSRFYIQLVKEKLFLLNALSSYRIQHEGIDDTIREFPPTSLEGDARINQLCEFVGSQLVLPGELVGLIYYEREGNPSSRSAAWARMRDDPRKLQTTASLLIDNGLVDVPDAYRTNHGAAVQFVSGLLAAWDDFTLQKARSETATSFANLALAKDQFVRALETYKVNLDTSIRDEFGVLLLAKVDLDSFSRWFAARVPIPSEILKLFHADYMQDSTRRRVAFTNVKAQSLTEKLAETLIRLSVIQAPKETERSSAVQSMTTILNEEQDFDVVSLRGSLWAFDELLEFGRDILRYAIEEEVIDNPTKVSLDYVLTILKHENVDYYQRHFLVCEHIAKAGSAFGEDTDKLCSVTKALIVLYFDSRSNPLRRQACMDAEADEGAAKILYCYVATREENEQPGAERRTPLKGIIDRVYTDTEYKYDDLVHFKRELNSGWLVPKLSILIDARLTSMVKQVDKLGVQKQKLETALQSVSTTVKQVLDTKFREDAVEKSLKMNLISAYIVTSKSQEQLFGKIIDKFLPKTVEDQSSKDATYKDLLLFAPKTAAGKSTRFGLVPFKTNFDQFSARFTSAFKTAVKNYLRDAGRPESEADRYTVNVVRVFPSDHFFKSVVGSEAETGYVEHPVSSLRKLVLKHYGTLEQMELAASVRSDEEQGVALKIMLEGIFNSKSTIYQMKKAELHAAIPGSKILEKMETGEFEENILSEYGLSLTALAGTYYRSKTLGETKAQDARAVLDGTVQRAVKRFGGKLTGNQEKTVTDEIEGALLNIGSIMDSFATGISQVNLSVAA